MNDNKTPRTPVTNEELRAILRQEVKMLMVGRQGGYLNSSKTALECLAILGPGKEELAEAYREASRQLGRIGTPGNSTG